MVEISKHQLANGLRVIHHYDPSTPMVAINMLYNVGARDESPNRTGFAHLFEHLMFGGSLNIPSYDQPVQMAGGENNAWTSNDITNYYLTLPCQNAEIGFWLESDRMLSLAFSEKSLEVQRQVVIEEFKQRYLNQPYGDIPLLMRPMAYQVHPYQWPTIGKEINHIENATLEEVKDFFFSHYAPNNAILSVAGNISLERCLELSKKWFGPLESRNICPRDLPREPEQKEARSKTVHRNVPASAIYKAYHMCNRTDPDYYASDLLSDILANGPSSRLYRRLVQDNPLFSEINAYISGDLDNGLFTVSGKPAPGITMQEAETAIIHELHSLVSTPLEEYELEKVKNKVESTLAFSNTNYLNKAMALAMFELTSQAEDLNHETELYRAVTPEKMQQVAGKIFRPENCSTLYYLKNE